jgi:hydroxypyruvate reductase
MPNLTQLRLAAREIFDETLRAVDPRAALQRTVRLNGSRLIVGDAAFEVSNRNIYSVAIGKAAFKMASALEQVLANSFSAGLMSGPQPAEVSEKPLSDRWRTYQGGHPLPDETSLMAAAEAFKLVRRANEERALIVFLISGGGSATLEWPLDQDISLADLRSANQALVGCGASIAEVNAVRRAFSAVKGGRLAERAPDCDQITLIVSDVPPGTERNVASGPTLTPPNNASQAQAVIDQFDLRARLPESILRSIENNAAYVRNTATSLRRHFVLLDNQSALQAAAAAARRLGFRAEIAEDISDQAIEDGCRQLLTRLKTFHDRVKTESATNGLCLISGGEFACPVNGPGLGGRNLETALRLATEQSASPAAHFVALCAGTDGIDGNSPAAGAIIDGTTTERAQIIGLDPSTFLERSDAYSFFVALGDVVATGATGTNVRDVRILLASNT